MNDIDKTKDLHRDKWKPLKKKKSNTNKRLRWGYILGIKKLQNMIDNENANSIKTFKVICGDILTEKNNTNKILRWVHILGIEKKITEYHRWWGWKKQKIYIEISGDILKKK